MHEKHTTSLRPTPPQKRKNVHSAKSGAPNRPPIFHSFQESPREREREERNSEKEEEKQLFSNESESFQNTNNLADPFARAFQSRNIMPDLATLFGQRAEEKKTEAEKEEEKETVYEKMEGNLPRLERWDRIKGTMLGMALANKMSQISVGYGDDLPLYSFDLSMSLAKGLTRNFGKRQKEERCTVNLHYVAEEYKEWSKKFERNVDSYLEDLSSEGDDGESERECNCHSTSNSHQIGCASRRNDRFRSNSSQKEKKKKGKKGSKGGDKFKKRKREGEVYVPNVRRFSTISKGDEMGWVYALRKRNAVKDWRKQDESAWKPSKGMISLQSMARCIPLFILGMQSGVALAKGRNLAKTIFGRNLPFPIDSFQQLVIWEAQLTHHNCTIW